jgi:N-acetylglucosaminyldiphosphoundecaprenol N-acetyl-beta-D-mannosaminyltransferase
MGIGSLPFDMRTSVNVLSVPVDDLNLRETLSRLEAFIEAGRVCHTTHQIATVNVDFVVKSQNDPELRYLLQQADLTTADGTPLFWAMKSLGARLEERVAGVDLVLALAEKAAESGYSFFLLGAAPGVAQKAAGELQARFPGLKIAGVHSPPYQTVLEMDRTILDEIRSARPDVLLVAFGNPKQEKWIAMHSREIGIPVMIGVGGTLDFIAGVRRRAPRWMQRMGLEWSHRLMQEPGRLWRRYVTDLIVFGSAFLKQWWWLRRLQSAVCDSWEMNLRAERNYAVLQIGGCITAEQAADLWAAGCRALDQSPEICLDLSKLQFLDSSIGGIILEIARLARKAGGELSLVCPSATVCRLLKAMRLDQVLPVYADLRQAALELEQSGALARGKGGLPATHTIRVEGVTWNVLQATRYLDGGNAANFQELGAHMLQNHPFLIVDLKDTVMITSAGMAALIYLHRQALAQGGALRMANLSRDVQRMIELIRLDKVLQTVPDMQTVFA